MSTRAARATAQRPEAHRPGAQPPETAREEARIGALVLRRPEPPEGSVPYRTRRRRPVEVVHVEAAVPPRTPGRISWLVALLGLGLLGFAAYVRSWPAVGSVSMALLALGWLVVRSRGETRRPRRAVRVDDDRLTVTGPGEPIRVSRGDVEAVGAGRDEAGGRTLWARIRGRGRTLLLGQLTDPEAEAAVSALREALRHEPADAPSAATSPARAG